MYSCAINLSITKFVRDLPEECQPLVFNFLYGLQCGYSSSFLTVKTSALRYVENTLNS